MVIPDGDLQALAESYARVQIGQIRQGVLADQLGFDYYFMSEHHFQPEGAEFSPNPLLAETAIAALTKRIRLAQGTNVTTEHHPVRIAEQAAMLDIISGGRLDFGIGRGYQPREVETLGAAFGSTIQDQEKQPRAVRGDLRDHPEVLDGGLVLAPRRVLHHPADLHPLAPPPDDGVLQGPGWRRAGAGAQGRGRATSTRRAACRSRRRRRRSARSRCSRSRCRSRTRRSGSR